MMETIRPDGNGARKAALVFILNAVLFFPILYQSYKHYDPLLTPWDVGAYMSMVEDPGAFEPPFRYRLLAPLAVRAMRVLPGYPIAVDFTEDEAVKRDFFHFSLLNAFITLLVSALLFAHLRKRLEEPFAYLGSVLYLFSFYCVVTNIIPMGDTSCHLAIMAAVMFFEAGRPVWFALTCLVGVFSKETMLIVMGLWVALNGWKDRRRLLYLLYLLPGAIAYIAATRIWPAESEFAYYSPAFLLRRVFSLFNPAEYDASFLFHVYLAQLPLLAALAAWLWLRIGKPGAAPRPNPELLIFPFLIWLGMTMDIDNSVGRVAFMAFPAIVLFEAMVAQAIVKALWGSGSGSTGSGSAGNVPSARSGALKG
jgi:hypothetical protein